MEDLFLMADVLSLSLERARFLTSAVNQGATLSETFIVRIGTCFSMMKDSKADHFSNALSTPLCKTIPKQLDGKGDLACPMIRILSSVYVLANSGFVIRFCPKVEPQVTLELLFLQIRSGYSLTLFLFFLMLVGTCCSILSASLCVVRPTYRASHQHIMCSL